MKKFTDWLRCLISHDLEYQHKIFAPFWGTKPDKLYKCKRCGKHILFES